MLNAPSPIVWTIAGSDPSGGAGIQVDLKVMSAFGVHGCSVITALTAQNTLGVQHAEPVSKSMLSAQLEALETDLRPAVIKTGMLGSSDACHMLARFLETTGVDATPLDIPLVCDPVLKSTSGADLLDAEALDILIRKIFPHVALLTPNLPETERLIGTRVSAVEATAERILELGPKSVLIKGGHAENDECRDYWTDGEQCMWLSSPRIDTKATHGTGCILSSAIAAALALGQDTRHAVITGKTFLNQCLKSPANVGAGFGPAMIEPFGNNSKDCPTIR